jgi:FkbM family methyltransferase
MRLALDLRESIQRDYFAGLYDRFELELVRRHLARGGDFVDVGAHVGLYTVTAALALRGQGRVLAFEPNPDACAQLVDNVSLNGCDNVIVVGKAVADTVGETLLHVPATPDPSFSSLEAGRFAEGEPVRVETTTLDREVEAAELAPAVVKVDVEGSELAVLDGMERTLDHHPVLLAEVGPDTAGAIEAALGERGYRAYTVGRRSLTTGLAVSRGTFNALFLPPDVRGTAPRAVPPRP